MSQHGDAAGWETMALVILLLLSFSSGIVFWFVGPYIRKYVEQLYHLKERKENE